MTADYPPLESPEFETALSAYVSAVLAHEKAKSALANCPTEVPDPGVHDRLNRAVHAAQSVRHDRVEKLREVRLQR